MLKTVLMALVRRFRRDDLTSYAAEIAFFSLLSIVPFIMILGIILTASNILNIDNLVTLLRSLEGLPETTLSLLIGAAESLDTSSAGLVSVAAVAALWTSSLMIRAIMSGIHMVYREREQRPLLRRYLLSFLYTLLLAVGILLLLVLTVYGGRIEELIFSLGLSGWLLPFVFGTISRLVPFVLLFVVIWSMYTVFPSRKIRLGNSLPGALFTMALMLLITFAYSLVVNNSARLSLLYGSLSNVVAMLLWFYWYAYSILFGLELNAVLYEDKEYQKLLQDRKARRQARKKARREERKRNRELDREWREREKQRRRARREWEKSHGTPDASAPENEAHPQPAPQDSDRSGEAIKPPV